MITVVFATYNGAETLPDMLQKLLELKAPAGGWKLVAVDNNSSDGSGDILRTYADRLPLTVLRHTIQGKNSALNAALSHLEGDLVVFTDDDVLPEPDWLQRIEVAAAQHPEFDLFGGVIRPHWRVTPPAWLREVVDLRVAYALTDAGQQAGEIAPETIKGPNMVVRAALLGEGGHRFDERIGPTSGQYAMGSETEFCMRVGSAGHRAYFVDDAIVSHIIPASNIDTGWLLGRAYRSGLGYWCKYQPANYQGCQLLGIPCYLYRQGAVTLAKYLGARLSGGPGYRFHTAWELHRLRGMMHQARLQSQNTSA